MCRCLESLYDCLNGVFGCPGILWGRLSIWLSELFVWAFKQSAWLYLWFVWLSKLFSWPSEFSSIVMVYTYSVLLEDCQSCLLVLRQVYLNACTIIRMSTHSVSLSIRFVWVFRHSAKLCTLFADYLSGYLDYLSMGSTKFVQLCAVYLTVMIMLSLRLSRQSVWHCILPHWMLQCILSWLQLSLWLSRHVWHCRLLL